MVAIRHARFNTGLMASIYYNAHRSGESEPIEVWDFIPGYERTAEETEEDKLRTSIRHGIVIAFSRLQGTPEQVRAQAHKMVARMREAGTEGAEEMVREVFEEVTKQAWD